MALIGPMSGSLTRLESGNPVFIAGENVTIDTTSSSGATSFVKSQYIHSSHFGDKSDGSATLVTGGAGAPLWTSYSSNVYTMTRDAFLDNLTVNSGVTLRLQGFMPYIAGTLVNSGTIEAKGEDANGGARGVGLTAASATGAPVSSSGAFSITTNNTNGSNSNSQTSAVGGIGGNGGSASIYTGGIAGSNTAPTSTLTTWKTLNFLLSRRVYSNLTVTAICGGTGGGGGAIGAGTASTSGAGGAGAPNLYLLCNILDNAGTIRSIGGNGSNAPASGGGTTPVGGGGGGGGGAILIGVNNVLNLGTVTSVGGTAGTGLSGGSSGANGNASTSIVILSGSA